MDMFSEGWGVNVGLIKYLCIPGLLISKVFVSKSYVYKSKHVNGWKTCFFIWTSINTPFLVLGIL